MASKILWYVIMAVIFCLKAPVDTRADIYHLSLFEACNLLVDFGFPTTGWKTYFDHETGCSSRQKSIGQGNPFKNQIAYYVDGHGNTVSQLRFILSVLNSDEAALANATFQNVSEFLILRTTGKEPPPSVANAMSSGIDLILKIDKIMVEITRTEWVMNTDWDSRNCYEIKLVIR